MNKDDILRQAHNVKKPTKAYAFQVVKDIINRDGVASERDLADLYAYFLPKVTKAKNWWQWLALARGQKDVRYYLNYIHSDGKRLLATDGYRVHVMLSSEYPSGYYTDEMVRVDDMDGTQYPDIDSVIPVSGLSRVDTDPGQWPIQQIGHKVYAYVLPGDTGVNKQYVDQAISLMERPVFYVTNKTSPMLIRDEVSNHFAVIMPLKL